MPCLFVSGTKDAFGTPDELAVATATIPGPVTHVWLDGKGHDLKRADDDVAEAVASWLKGLATAAGRRARRRSPGPRG